MSKPNLHVVPKRAMRYEDYPIHPLADAFPLLQGEDFEQIVQSIASYGLLEPIVLCKGVVLDGRNRLRACLAAKIEPDFVEYDDALEIPDFIWLKNASRRHLTPDMRAAVATEFLAYEEAQAKQRKLDAFDPRKANEARWHAADDGDELEAGDPVCQISDTQDAPVRTSDRIAQRAEVSRYKAEQAIAVKRHDDEHGTQLLEQVKAGETRLRDAVREVRNEPPRERVSNSPEAAAERLERLRELAAKGANAEQIADELNIGEAHVRHLARREGIKLFDFHRGKERRIDVNRVVSETVNQAHALTAGLDLVESRLDGLDESQIPVWVQTLGESIAELRKLRNTLRRRLS